MECWSKHSPSCLPFCTSAGNDIKKIYINRKTCLLRTHTRGIEEIEEILPQIQ